MIAKGHVKIISLCMSVILSLLSYCFVLTFFLLFFSRLTLQGEVLDPEDAFDMLTSMLQVSFRPVYGDADVLTLKSFDGFEITKQVCVVLWHDVM